MVVPLMILLMNFSTKQAVGISTGIVVINSFVMYFMALFKTHPKIPTKTLIDYNLALSMVAPMMVGALLGSIIAVVIPSIIQLITLLLFIVLSFAKTLQNAIDLWKEETKEKKAAIEMSAKTTLPIIKEYKYIETSEICINPTKFDGNTRIKNEQIEIKNIAEDVIEKKEDSPEISRLKKIDAQNFNIMKTIVPIIIVLLALALVLLRGGKGLSSVVGITKCSSPDWGVIIVYSILNILVFAFCAYLISKEQKERKACGWIEQKGEVTLSMGGIFAASIASFVVGFIGAITGIGGNLILTPVLMTMGYNPQVISSTGIYLVFLSKIISGLVYFASGLLPLDYLLALGIVSATFVALAIWRLNLLIKKLGRQSIITLVFLVTLVIAILLIGYAGMIPILDGNSDLFEFKSLCD